LLDPFLEFGKRIFLLTRRRRSRDRSRRGNRNGGLNAIYSCITYSEVIKIILGDSSLILNGVAISLAEVVKELGQS